MFGQKASFAGCFAALSLTPLVAQAAPSVWVIDDGEKIKADATSLPFATGTSNPVWAPGQPVRLTSMRNETVALQVVVGADASALAGVTVDLDSLAGPSGAVIRNDPSATDPSSYVGRPIERFVEHAFDVARASGGSDPSASLGWSAGSGPADGQWTGLVPDALIPVEVAPAFEPYPMPVAANRNGIVWIDVTVPRDQPAGAYRGDIAVKAGGQTLATLPVELEVVQATLPDVPVKTMLYYDPSEVHRRVGDAAAEEHLWKLYHRHRVSPMHGATTASDVEGQFAALDGSEYTAAHGYAGPGEGQGDGVLSLGTYGSLGEPSSTGLAQVAAIADLLAQKKLFASTDVFVYATDEDCGSPYGAAWKQLLTGSADANVHGVRVGWTCSENPASQPVDVPIVIASSYDPGAAARAVAAGKKVWIYNGSRPQTDAFLTDTAAVALRANGWIAAMAGIDRWFYWETTFWYDDNRGGHGAYDPFTTAETFHNQNGDWCEGDGVLVYPGKQVDVFTEHSIGFDGVLASIRLKNLRRGIEDAGYYQLAHAADPAKAEAIAKGLLPKILSAASDGDAVSWTESGKPWADARQALLALVPHDPAPPAGDAGTDATSASPEGESGPVESTEVDGRGDAATAPASNADNADDEAGAQGPGGGAQAGAGSGDLASNGAAGGCAVTRAGTRGQGEAVAAAMVLLASIAAGRRRPRGRRK